MFINKNNVICNIKGLDMIINTENGAVVGVDRDNLQSYKKLINEELPISLDKELYDFLIEADKLDVGISFSIFTTGCEKIYEDYSLLNDDLSHISKYLSSYKIEDIPINNTLEGKRHCGTGCNILSVGADGDVYPCHMLMEEQFKMGNIVNNDMITILENNKTNRKCWENDVDDISGCRQCTYKYLCGGGCRARAHLINGNIMKKDPFCKMFKGFYDEIFATMRNKMEE